MSTIPAVGQDFREGPHYASPVTRALVLGYYDGPTQGALQCGTGGPTYHFRMLGWDDATQDVRIFALTPLPLHAFDALVAVFSQHGSPRWPLWVPQWYEGIEATDPLLSVDAKPTWAIATADLMGDIISARRIITAEPPRTPLAWASYLGLPGDLHWTDAEALFPNQSNGK